MGSEMCIRDRASPQKAGRVEKRKSVKSTKGGDLVAKIKDEDSDQ